MWSNTLTYPVYIAAASSLILLLHVALAWRPIKRLYVHLTPLWALSNSYDSFEEEPDGQLSRSERNGGSVIYAYKLARVIGCFALFGLSLETRELDVPFEWPQVSVYVRVAADCRTYKVFTRQ